MARLSRFAILIVALPLALGACKKKPVAVQPEPQAPAMPVNPPANTTPPATTTPTDDAAARRAIEEARAKLSEVIYYDYDSDELRADARAVLDEKLRILNANPTVRLRIEGHTDERGSDEYNLALGRRRADQAKRYLADRGIDASRIETMSFGRERPAVSGMNEEAWSQNRRGEFVIVAGGTDLKAP